MQPNTNSSTQYRLPDLVSLSTSFTDATNLHWTRASIESNEWINSYNVFSDRRSVFFRQGQSELLASHAWPYAGYEEFRTCCDYVNLLFVVDDISDAQGQEGARKTLQTFLNVLRDEAWDDGSVIAKMTKEYVQCLSANGCGADDITLAIHYSVRNRFIKTGIQAQTYRRFVKSVGDYVDAVVEEARLRDRDEVLDMGSFQNLRRNNSAVITALFLIPYCLHIDLPDEVIEHPVCKRMFYSAVDMVCWANVYL